ncbi:ABC transporter ATP-binding protein/permease [Ruminococcus sp. OA3]|uniref:ABC transporter ATP-binding protein n=1 Tax=Ruminococcus sp. OA3 TaxID=2914164 RepID=UPI001F058DB7|nr:ABC transporter ATP-binding protein [Ruminococcus sp. OA3]MCH1983131.1 ABC transporter ATP-binding protein/permease [Ruminococcus sp. OA3]
MITLMKRILGVSGQYKGRIQGAFVFCFLKSMLSKAPMMLSFFALTAFYDNTADKGLCLWLGGGMVLCLILQILFHHISDRMQSAAGYMVFADMRMKLGRHLRKMPMGYFTEGNIGKISSVLSSDMVFIEENCMMTLADMMSYLFSQAVMIVFLLFFNLWLGLTAALVTLGIWLVARGMQRDALAHSSIRQEQNEKLTDSVLDFTEGIGIIKTYNLLGDKSKELTGCFEKMCKTSIEFEENQSPWMRRLNMAYGLGAAAVLAAAMLLYQTGLMNAVYLVGMLLFAMELFGPIKALYGNATRLTVMNSCMDRIEEVFDEKELPDGGGDQIPETYDGPEVNFKNVSFGYGEKEVLHDISLTLPKNQMMALVGPSGGGKSTIASLLTRFWDVNRGQVLIRGKDVRDIRLSDLMNHISMVFQRVYLFQDTVYNNISMGRPDATREEVMEAAKKARCYDFIMTLPQGFDTMIGEGGESLSGGEKQRISIARCILKDSPVVILDEATANVDADNEIYIQEAISELCRGKTLLVIAHRLNTIQSADQILVIADGRIAQQGTHGQLIARNGIYRNFVTVRESSRGWSSQLS